MTTATATAPTREAELREQWDLIQRRPTRSTNPDGSVTWGNDNPKEYYQLERWIARSIAQLDDLRGVDRDDPIDVIVSNVYDVIRDRVIAFVIERERS